MSIFATNLAPQKKCRLFGSVRAKGTDISLPAANPPDFTGEAGGLSSSTVLPEKNKELGYGTGT
jgi:hypothetical protein